MIRHLSLGAVTLFGTLFLQSCGGAQQDAKSANEDEGISVIKTENTEELKALFERELKLPESVEVRDPDGAWAARGAAVKAATVSKDEGMTSVRFMLADDIAIDCFYYDDTIDTGQAVTGMLEHMSKNVEFTHVAAYRVAAVANYPVVFLEGRYLFENEGENVMGSVKIGVTPRFSTPVTCLMDEPGYSQTFADFMSQMLSTLQTQEEETPAKMSEIWAYRLSGIPVGYQMTQFIEKIDGTTTTVDLSAQFYPVSPSEVSTNDVVKVIVSDSAGLLKGHYLSIEGRQQEYELDLLREGKNKYNVSGSFKGKDMKASFEIKQGLTHPLSLYEYFLRNQKKAETLSAIEYSPELDPSTPSGTQYSLSPEDGSIVAESGNMKLTLARDKTGLPVSFSMPIGDRVIEGSLIARDGKL